MYLTAIVIALLPFSAFSSDKSPSTACQTIFEKSFKEVDPEDIAYGGIPFGGDYVHHRCHENVARLLNRLRELDSFSETDAEVLILSSNRSFFGAVIDHHELMRTPTRFKRHFVLKYQGFIFDHDYTTSPVLVTVEEYFSRFFNSSDQVSTFVSMVPAVEYNPTHAEYYANEKIKFPLDFYLLLERTILEAE